jgi:aspartyl/asparaginyl beta-hydroxylase (cupin superfamily)
VLTDGARPVDVFATPVNGISDQDMQRLKCLSDTAKWREVPGRNYDTADIRFWEKCSRAFFIRIPPGGSIPRHHDDFIPGTTHHLVLATNDGCTNGWIDRQGRERSIHMREGIRYLVAREPLHWAFNKGQSDRIHLLVEFE